MSVPEKHDPNLHLTGPIVSAYNREYDALIGYGANDFGALDLKYEKWRAKDCRRTARTFQKQVDKHMRSVARVKDPNIKATHQRDVDANLLSVANWTREAEERERRVREYGGAR